MARRNTVSHSIWEETITFPELSIMSNLKAKTEYRSVIDCLLVPRDHMIS